MYTRIQENITSHATSIKLKRPPDRRKELVDYYNDGGRWLKLGTPNGLLQVEMVKPPEVTEGSAEVVLHIENLVIAESLDAHGKLAHVWLFKDGKTYHASAIQGWRLVEEEPPESRGNRSEEAYLLVRSILNGVIGCPEQEAA